MLRKCRVFAFEAEAQNYATLEMNHFLDRAQLLEPLTAFNLALSDRAGTGHIRTRQYGAGEHGKILDAAISQDSKAPFQAEHVQSVLAIPLQQVVESCGLPPPQVLKIDVDGSEASVLRGGVYPNLYNCVYRRAGRRDGLS